jgi:hypothetical protein
MAISKKNVLVFCTEVKLLLCLRFTAFMTDYFNGLITCINGASAAQKSQFGFVREADQTSIILVVKISDMWC